MTTGTPPTLYLRYEGRQLPPEWVEEIRALESILTQYSVRVISLTERVKDFGNPEVDHLAMSDAMLAVVGQEESTILLGAGELAHFNRAGKPNMVIHHANKRIQGIWASELVEAKSVEDLVQQMHAFVAKTIGAELSDLRAELPDLRAELESTPTPEVARPRQARSA